MSFSIKKEGEVVVVDVEGQLIVGNRQQWQTRLSDPSLHGAITSFDRIDHELFAAAFNSA